MNISTKLLLIATYGLCIPLTALSSEKPNHQTNQQYSIDKLNPEDMQAMVDLCVTEWDWVINSKNDLPLSYKIETCEDSIRDYKDKNQLKILHENGKPAGFIAYLDEGDKTGFIGMLAVEQSFRGKGYGEALLKHSIEDLRNQELESIKLYAKPNNLPALKLYQKVGFKEKINKYWRNPDVVCLEYNLSSMDKLEITK